MAKDFCLGILEVQGLGPAFVIADRVLKTAQVQIPGIELNSLGGLTLKIVGAADAVRTAVDHGSAIAQEMQVPCAPTAMLRFAESAQWLVYCKPRYSVIIQDRTQLLPQNETYSGALPAIGVLETKGFVGMVAGVDVMLKAAGVQLIGKEKIGATYVDALVWGDLSAVNQALEAGKVAAQQVGHLVGGYVVARPHPDLLALLPG